MPPASSRLHSWRGSCAGQLDRYRKGMGFHHAFGARETVERPPDKAVRRANLRRIGRLFRPYTPKLSIVAALIVVSSGLGVIPAFLIKALFNNAIPNGSLGLTTALVGAAIAISIVTGAFGVVQSYLSTHVGQSVMHDLRTAVYRHLQRLSLAFFTKTRTGEVQSRIANDIGGVDNVLTSTATSVMSTITTIAATVIAMFLLDWKLALLVARAPARLRPGHAEGRRSSPQGCDHTAGVDGGHQLARAGIALGLGDPARQDDGALRGARSAFRRGIPAPRGSRGEKQDDGPLDDGV